MVAPDDLLDRVAQAIRAEQRLTGELAHELRTPLTALRGEAELALLGTPPPDVRERFVRVLEQVDRLNGTITALLEVARHSTGSPRQADVGEVVAALDAAHGEDVFRAGFRRSDDTEGAGLGLPLARRVAATVGGTVSVTSAHDPTTFTIDLPPA